MLFYKWIFNLQIHYNWRLAFTLPQLANTIRVATISATAIDYWLFNQQTQPALTTASATRYTTCIDNTFHNSCWISHCHYVQFSTLPLTTRYTTAFTIRVAFPTAIELLQLPLVDNYTPACTTHQNIFHHHQLLNLKVVLTFILQPASTTALTTPSSFRVAFHQLSSISHGLFYFWLFSQQTQPQLLWLHPLHFVLQFPLPLGSHFPPPLTTQTTSCSIVPSPTSKHNEIHVWAFTIASTHHFASAMQSVHHPSSNQQAQLLWLHPPHFVLHLQLTYTTAITTNTLIIEIHNTQLLQPPLISLCLSISLVYTQ